MSNIEVHFLGKEYSIPADLQTYLELLKVSKPKTFPTYQLVDAGELADVSSFEIKIVNYTIDE